MRLRECIVGYGLTCYETLSFRQTAVTYLLVRLAERVVLDTVSACGTMDERDVTGCMESLEF